MVDGTIETCKACNGTGHVGVRGRNDCEVCYGRGYIASEADWKEIQDLANGLLKMSLLLTATAEDLSAQLVKLVQRLQKDDR